jgi:4-amino-4-deoxy-L-arabinose transferase-like glycosyltransferase
MRLFSLRSFGSSAYAANGSLLRLLALTAVFVGSVAFVGPAGDFPLNDDWSYAIATRTLVATHTWMPTGWTSMSLITNALWAVPFCAVSSCGFGDLRLSTLLASLLLFSATYFLVASNSKEPSVPLVAALLVAFNPIAYALSFTFMTDILFSALVTTSAFLFIVSLERNSVGLAVLGTVVALAATMSRQLGLRTPLAYLVVRLLQAGDWRRKLAIALAPLILCAASLVLFNSWLRETGKLPAFYDLPSDTVLIVLTSPVKQMISSIGWHLTTALLYLGLFSMPMLLLTGRPTFVTKVHPWLRTVPTAAGGAAAFLAHPIHA